MPIRDVGKPKAPLLPSPKLITVVLLPWPPLDNHRRVAPDERADMGRVLDFNSWSILYSLIRRRVEYTRTDRATAITNVES